MVYRLTCFFLVFLSLSACRKPLPKRAFYYWKTTFHISPGEEKCLTRLHVQKLYLRMFDVDWDEARGSAMPVGKINFASRPPVKLEIIPVVYIVNKTLQKTSPENVSVLGAKILILVQGLMSSQSLPFDELQIDCDWTESTKASYFRLLTFLKNELARDHQTLSATIRLHQVKYASITGVPPVQRGMLMYYNMGKIDASSPRNSIYNSPDASRYVEYVRKYPLPLDVVLPVFSWGIHIRGNKVIDLLNNMTSADFKNNTNFNRTDSLTLRADSSFFFRGFYFMRNDRIKLEEVTPALCLQAAQQLAGKVNVCPASVAVFHFDSLMITRYEEKKLEEIFNSFH